jgi:3',5'-nucleoside bisphosphate phosphatase
LKTYRAELHVHTVLSPCAQVEMIPPLIIRSALENHINLIAITDHNHTANIAAVQKAAEGSGVVVLPGMEIQTREEVHVLCLFDTLEQAYLLQAFVDQKLPGIINNADFFGEQFVVDETGDFISSEDRLLINSVNASFEQVYKQVAEIGGLFIPAHINRKTFGLLANLGLVPSEVEVEALEISRHIQPDEALRKYPQIKGYPLIQNGDVHGLDEFLGSTEFTIQKPTIAEIRLAIQNELGRSCKILNLPNP